MKALLLLLLVLAGVWLWRSWQTPGRKVPPPATPDPLAPQAMLRCMQCGMHLPANEAIVGKKGPYCSLEHQRQSEP